MSGTQQAFLHFSSKKTPLHYFEMGQSADGFIAPLEKETNKPVWITNMYSRQLVHKWRTEEQAILVGTQTVLDDNPSLNARDFYGNNPVRIALDRQNRIPNDYTIKNGTQKTIIYSEDIFLTENKNISYKKVIFDTHFLDFVISDLHQEELQSIIIEGGSRTLQAFIDKNLWDEARVFIGNLKFTKGIAAPKINHLPITTEDIQGDQLKLYKNDSNHTF